VEDFEKKKRGALEASWVQREDKESIISHSIAPREFEFLKFKSHSIDLKLTSIRLDFVYNFYYIYIYN